MARNPKTNKAATKTSSVKRRADLRRNMPRRVIDLRDIFSRGDLLRALVVIAVFVLLATVLVTFSREQVLVRDGQIMTDTRLKRLDYRVEDERATETKREEARLASPRVYDLNASYLSRLRAALVGLPKAVAGKTALDEISEELINEFQLTAEGLSVLQEFVEEGEATQQWQAWVEKLTREELRRRPLLTSQEFQIYMTTANRALVLASGDLQIPYEAQPIELRSDARTELGSRLRDVIAAAGFPATIAPHVAARLVFDAQPTIMHDSTRTESFASEAAASVEPVMVEHRRGEVLYRRGDVLSAKQYEETLAEAERFAAAAPWAQRWSPRGASLGLLTILIAFLATYIVMAYPRIIANILRIGSVTALMIAMLALTVLITTQAPNLIFAAAIAPTLFVTIIVLLAYDSRLALILGSTQALLVTLALGNGLGWFILLIAGCGVAIIQLRDVRHRNSLISAATYTAVVLGAGALLLGFFEMPLVPGAVGEILWNTLWAVVAAFAVGFLVLGILPSIERLFDITTGMTLAELRDPKQPLLRQLQQTAPGTYNHSLQVANVAEAAADAIGADSLLVYVGALYHDIGKMNKPEYFVENQAGGINKHDKLSPAMSLLVIVGHVKDGVEMAKEYNLPRALQHFIESHHGTTLVEYFYHAARTQAKQGEKGERGDVAEFEFRYPGPKPATKEAAILMLSDAVESATRAMAEPTPGRIESLVRDMARKRLMDGQFNQCDLTFRELALIEDAIISRLCAVHHGRISYPTTQVRKNGAAAGDGGSNGEAASSQAHRPAAAG